MGSGMGLILYRELECGDLFYRFADWMERVESGASFEADRRALSDQCAQGLNGLLCLAESRGLSGNLWQAFLTMLLAENENPYSRACENRQEAGGALQAAALHDFAIFRRLFAFDFSAWESRLGVFGADLILRCAPIGEGAFYPVWVRERLAALCSDLAKADSDRAFQAAVAQFYGELGVGKLGLHKAFRVKETPAGAALSPILSLSDVTLSDLIGYESAKKKLTDNTEAFVSGRKANNCLLYGDAGTGKSTSIKAIANQYYGRGLRVIELYKHQFRSLSDVIALVRDRNYKFIIYMDDLSFEDFEVEYKYLKAVMEGGLEPKPDNVLIYATSNRRHLVREKFSDKVDLSDDLHSNDTVQEKLSLAARFGVQVYFGAPDKKEFLSIVKGLAKKQGMAVEEDELALRANQWELSHGGRSGRAARQLLDDMMGKGGA